MSYRPLLPIQVAIVNLHGTEPMALQTLTWAVLFISTASAFFHARLMVTLCPPFKYVCVHVQSSLVPRPHEGEERAWYTLLTHALSPWSPAHHSSTYVFTFSLTLFPGPMKERRGIGIHCSHRRCLHGHQVTESLMRHKQS